MKAVILAGGKGTRLRPLTNNIPKPLIPIVDSPCIEYVLKSLMSANINDVIITTAYMPEKLIRAIGDGKEFNFSTVYSFESTPYGTAGAVKNVEGFLNETFVVLSGDVLVDIDLKQIIEEHKKSGASVTMALTKVENPTEFGIVGLENGFVSRFKEKPAPEEVFSNLINAGIYIIEPDVLEYIPGNTAFDFSKNLFPLIMGKGMKIHGVILDGLWMDIGRPSDYIESNREITLKISGGESVFVSPEAKVEDGVEFKGVCYVGPGSHISKGCIINNSYIHSGTKIDMDCEIVNSVVLKDNVIGWKTRLHDTITGKKCKIDADVIMKNCILGENIEVTRHTVVENLKMESGKVGI